MPEYTPPDFEAADREVAEALSTLKRHGLQVNFPEDVQKRLDSYILFEGDDGLFKALLPSVKNYFEYGCGKSTEYLYKYSNVNIYSVDTSQEWASKIQGLSKDKGDNRLNVKWVDVGPVIDWGTPESFVKRQNFAEYANWFWELGVDPDLVVIDGRFRVCCFLTSIKFAPVGTKILFDDYADRPSYHVAEEFLPVIDRCGRQVLFEVDSHAKEKVDDDVISGFRNVVG
ncbi:MAG: hypothetical protein H6917_13290 [Novosphingobium sp.]|nr:hypothetical protein [Rhodobiaceae bacterium]MCB2074730.1 hypothetical protein [Novosphingobium sp.]MCP5403344.1 hypothetical protein [Novosphingobium sp.]